MLNSLNSTNEFEHRNIIMYSVKKYSDIYIFF